MVWEAAGRLEIDFQTKADAAAAVLQLLLLLLLLLPHRVQRRSIRPPREVRLQPHTAHAFCVCSFSCVRSVLAALLLSSPAKRNAAPHKVPIRANQSACVAPRASCAAAATTTGLLFTLLCILDSWCSTLLLLLHPPKPVFSPVCGVYSTPAVCTRCET